MKRGQHKNLSKVLSGFHKNPKGQGKMHGSGLFDDDSLSRGYMKSAQEQSDVAQPKVVLYQQENKERKGYAGLAKDVVKEQAEKKKRMLDEVAKDL
jgi:hypothetical protein